MMKFTTLQEYFYKLQNVLYMLVLAPLLAFVYLFMFTAKSKPVIFDKNSLIIIGGILMVVAVDWFLASVFFYKALDKAQHLTELRLKLEKYYTITVIRFALGSFACLVLAWGFFLTTDSIFTASFLVGLVLFFSLWPRPSKVCRDLKLTGDERQMVLYKKVTL